MTTTAGRGVERHPDPDETVTAAGACEDVTEVVPPTTEAAPELAWSHEEPVTEALSRPWRWVWAIAGVGVLCAVVAAVVIGAVGLGARRAAPSHTRAEAGAPPVSTPLSARPPLNDSEYVATAISPRALRTGSLKVGGFGAGDGATQSQADQVALAECRSNPTYADTCVLVNAGMFHGCISVAANSTSLTWTAGTGADPDAADADALRKLTVPGLVVSVQCSNPPGWLTPESPPASPPPPAAQAAPSPPPPPPTPAAAPAPTATPKASAPNPDTVFRSLVRTIPGMTVVDWGITEAGAHRVCGYLASGHSRDAAVQQVLANDSTFTPWQASAMVNASTTAYCPQFGV